MLLLKLSPQIRIQITQSYCSIQINSFPVGKKKSQGARGRVRLDCHVPQHLSSPLESIRSLALVGYLKQMQKRPRNRTQKHWRFKYKLWDRNETSRNMTGKITNSCLPFETHIPLAYNFLGPLLLFSITLSFSRGIISGLR